MAEYGYSVSTGAFTKDGVLVATGYSGYGTAKNNSACEGMAGRGPIPRGRYIIGEPHYSKVVGPVAMRLLPLWHTACGRSALMIHGDNTTHTASRGCVILPRVVRDEIAATVSRDARPTVLVVVD
jgi:hypothetical protein